MSKTQVANLINPEVMADMITATLPKRIKFAKIAKMDTTLTEQPGNTIVVPCYAYVGDAEDVAEGVAMGTSVLTATSTKATVKKVGKAIELTDEAVLSGYGDPVGEAKKQLEMAIASKIDSDCLEKLYEAKLVYTNTTKAIGYDEIVKAVDLLEEDADFKTSKVMFVHPKQVTHLRLDPEFKDINKYPLKTVMHGTIGEVAGCLIVPSKKVKYEDGCYLNPIVITNLADKFSTDTEALEGEVDDSAEALTIYMKRDVQLETDRDVLAKTTVVTADEHYTVALSNEAKVVIAKLKGAL